MAKIDSFQSAYRSLRPARHRRWVVALAACGAVMLTGLGATALSLMERTAHLPVEDPATPQLAAAPSGADAPAVLAEATQAEAALRPAPAGPSEVQRASKADPLRVQQRHELAASGPWIERAAPTAAVRPAVARRPPQASPRPGPDRFPTWTASVEPAADTSPDSEAAQAETATEAAAPESQPEPADPMPQPDPKPVAAIQADQAEPAQASRTAPVLDDVNMRAGPSNKASVITVVPNGTQVEVIDCDYWCKVEYAGKRGWIYKSFVHGAS